MSDIGEHALNPENNDLNQPKPPYYQSLPVQSAPALAPFKGEITDAIFALFTFVLGYLTCRWFLSAFFGWGVALFTVLYLGATLFYLLKKGVRLSAESWFWFGVTLLTGLSFALWNNMGLIPLRNMFLFAAAVYWIMSASGTLVGGKTTNYLLLDSLNALFVIPFRNFINQYRALGAFRGNREKDGKKALSIILGIVLALVVLLIVTPQLLRADSGGFSDLIMGILNVFRFDMDKIFEFLFYCFLAVPTAAYMFGLVSGSAVKRGTDAFTTEKAERAVSAIKVAAPVTVNIILTTVCALYAVFIACQVPYFFSAFQGTTPDGWATYSGYARQGFFELCGIAAINLGLIIGANVFSKRNRPENTALKFFNIVLSLITLLLIATAFSKMALYIDIYGLTTLRILPCVFMLLLSVIFVGVIVLQRMHFSIVRVALVTGAALFTILCLADMDGIVVAYNTDRYLAGTLEAYDTDILYRAGPVGVPCALEVYSTAEGELQYELRRYLKAQEADATAAAGTYLDTYEYYRVRALLEVRSII